MTVLRQNFCNISSISKNRNDFTHHQLKDYDVFSVKKLEIRPTEKSASKIPKVRGRGFRGFWKKLIFKPHIFGRKFPKAKPYGFTGFQWVLKKTKIGPKMTQDCLWGTVWGPESYKVGSYYAVLVPFNDSHPYFTSAKVAKVSTGQ